MCLNLSLVGEQVGSPDHCDHVGLGHFVSLWAYSLHWEWKIRYHFYHFNGQLPLVTARKCDSLHVSANAV